MLVKGLNFPTFTTEFTFPFSERGKTGVSPNRGSFIYNTLTFRDQGESTPKTQVSPTESRLDLPKLAQVCPNMVKLNLSQLKVY